MSERRPSDKRVPSIPPTEGIADPQTRAVVEALVQGWQVRNGQTAATDDHRFITKADLLSWINDEGSLTGIRNSGNAGGGGFGPGLPVPPGGVQEKVNTLVDAAVNFIKNSEFFQFLGRRIDRIEPDLAKLGVEADRMQTYIKAEINQRNNADNAIVESLNQVFAGLPSTVRPVWAMRTDGFTVQANNAGAFVNDYKQIATVVGTHSTLIQQETTARANADGKLFGQWSVKIDQDGYVSGFGLSSSTTPSSTLSEFYVRADVFGIGSPGQPRPIIGHQPDGAGGTKPIYGPIPDANIPFSVFTTAQADSSVPGGVIPPGVYITDAFIKRGAIGHAQIGLAEIDALLLDGHAVTVPFSNSATGVALSTTHTTVVSVTVAFPAINFRAGSAEGYSGIPLRPSATVVMGSFFMQNNTTGHALSAVHFDLTRNGVSIAGGAFSVDDGRSYQCCLIGVDTNPDVSVTYAIKAWTDGSFSADANSAVIFAMGAQR